MDYEKLKKSDLPPIAFGTWAWGSGINGGSMMFGKTTDTAEIMKAFDAAQKSGFTVWDTAAVYGMGSSELLLAKCAGQNPDIIYSTKFTPTTFLQPQSAMEKAIDRSLERLQRSHIDIYWIHLPANVKKWTTEIIPLVQKKKVKYVGLSNHSLTQLKAAQQILNAAEIPLSAIQNHYSLLYRASENSGILDWSKENEIPFFAYMVLEQGVLTGKYTPDNPFPRLSNRGHSYPKRKLEKIKPLLAVLKSIADAHGTESSAIAISWAISKGTIPLVGITKASHLRACSEAISLFLSPAEIQTLEETANTLAVNTKGLWEKRMV